MTIAKTLKNLRTNKGMTLDEVSTRLGIAKQTIFKYENGIVTNIPSDKIEKLATIYNVTPCYIMGWEKENDNDNKPAIITPQEQTHLDKYRQLTDENKTAVDDFTEFQLDKQQKELKQESISG